MPRGYRPPLPISERLERKSVVDGDCLRWTGAGTTDGYGQMTIGSRLDGTRRLAMVHRVAYEEFVGPIPGGYEIDHICRVRDCWNPAHLRALSADDHHEFRSDAQRSASSRNVAKARAARWVA